MNLLKKRAKLKPAGKQQVKGIRDRSNRHTRLLQKYNFNWDDIKDCWPYIDQTTTLMYQTLPNDVLDQMLKTGPKDYKYNIFRNQPLLEQVTSDNLDELGSYLMIENPISITYSPQLVNKLLTKHDSIFRHGFPWEEKWQQMPEWFVRKWVQDKNWNNTRWKRLWCNTNLSMQFFRDFEHQIPWNTFANRWPNITYDWASEFAEHIDLQLVVKRIKNGMDGRFSSDEIVALEVAANLIHG